LKDRLSRLTFAQACKLLGADGNKLIMKGGKFGIPSIEDNVYLGDDLFRLSVDGAVVTITLMTEARRRLHFNCNKCETLCEHVGAAFALILEEKTVLGLAKPPKERIPAESLSDTELIDRALEDRQERAKTERMIVKSTNPRTLWTDYIVTNSLSGKSYKVALRGWKRGDSYCCCPDFRKNTLGTCKHIMNVQRKMERKFKAVTRKRAYRQKDFAVHIAYNEKLELRLLYPTKMNEELAKIVKPIKDHAVKDVHKLLQCVRKLEASDQNVIIYPDAVEYIDFLLHQERMTNLVKEIQNLLKAELLPYQLDGVAFAAGVGRAVLADDMGLGKTIQGIGVAELLSRESSVEKVLVVCPTSLKSQWRSEIHRFCDRDCQLVLGSAPQRATQYDNDCFFTICNYEQVLRDTRSIEQVQWDLIILDEGQRIKNWAAKTSRMIKSLRSRFALVLSGTPLENRLDDLFSVVEFVNDRRLGPSFRFFNTHRVVDEKGRLLGYKNLDKLRKKLSPDEQFEINRGQKMIIQSIVNKPYFSEMDLLRLQKALLI